MVKISSLLIFLTINNGFIKCTQVMANYVSKAIHFYKRDLQNVCRGEILSSSLLYMHDHFYYIRKIPACLFKVCRWRF